MSRPDLKSLLAETTAAQNRAANPRASAWVSANAGTGKTHVLTSRVLRLLLDGTKPQHILCLTFTKAAATEMSTRVFKRLAEWASAPDEKLQRALDELLGRSPNADEIEQARQLFALAIETPGGLKVQTIHAFCERLLQRFPLEASVPPGFTVLDDAHARTLLREATDATLRRASEARGDRQLNAALQTIVAHAADDRFNQMLGAMIAKREWLDAARPDLSSGVASFADAEARYRSVLGIRKGISLEDVLAAIAALLPDDICSRTITALSGGSANDVKAADRLKSAANGTDDAAAAAALGAFFLTSEGEPRKSLMTKKTAAQHPDLDAALIKAQNRFIALDEERRALETLDISLALLRLADDVRTGYAREKARRAALDYDDLITKAAALLSGDTGGVPQWVHFKLDGGLSHILVDEAQDTSPMQWRVVAGLAADFFSDSAGHGDGVRTVFAVGDEKQSIYGFQGAAPHMLAEVGKRFAEDARAVEHPWHNVPLTLSFRSAPPVLAAVDAVFADPAHTPGLTFSGDAIRHQPHREGHAGLVEIWEPEAPTEAVDTDAFMPLDERPAASPATRLAGRIADQIRHWLDTGERLESQDRPIEAGDILILVRRRGLLAPALIAALKQRGIPVSGADRMALEQQIAIQDLMAVAAVILLPEDDLALASVLKSPLIGLGDDDLLRFAPQRKGSLWSALLAAASAGDARLAAAAEIIKQWRRSADFRPPFEFYAELLDGSEGGRAKLIARLGPEAADAIDEFMNLALRYDEAEPPSLQGFLDLLGQSRREIKRDLEHGGNQVRVMTVHGAKGLEAPVVFLPDTCSTDTGAARGGIVELTDAISRAGGAKPVVWPATKGSLRVAAIADARNQAKSADAEERNRLLYVALTRARDRLYVCGYDGKKARPADCWYELTRAGLADRLVELRDEEGRTILRIAAPQQVPPTARKSEPGLDAAPEPLPDWARRRAPREPALAIPIAPSRLAPLDIDTDGEPVEPPAAPATRSARSAGSGAIGGENRFLRGTLTHALLQYLPTCPAHGWSRAAQSFLEIRGHALPARVRASIIKETLAVLQAPNFAAVFGPRSRAEVAIVAEIPPPDGAGTPLRIAGQIDRLVETDGEILIVDYKTNRPPPRDLGEVPPAYIHQLAAYRMAVQRIFGAAKIRAALLWTDGPQLMEISEGILERAQSGLFTPN